MLPDMNEKEREAADLLLGTTRSVRRRIDLERPVEPAVIEECIDLAVQAPTGARAEGWRFVVVTEPEKRQALGALYRRALDRYREMAEAEARRTGAELPAPRPTVVQQAGRLQEFPVLILVCIEGRPEPDDVARQVAFYGSILPAAWSLMLALRSRGLGATWTTLHLANEREAAELLGIPADVTQTVLLPVAYMRDAVLRRADRRPAREVTYWNEWGRPLGSSS
jgi:nitroreductase